MITTVLLVISSKVDSRNGHKYGLPGYESVDLEWDDHAC